MTMNGCRLGVVNTLWSGVQVTARRIHCAKAASSPSPRSVPSPSRYFASWPVPRKLPPQTKRAAFPRVYSLAPACPSTLPRWLGARTIIGGPHIPTHYTDLPPSYRDEDGLPFAKSDLTTDEVVAVFGPYMSTSSANRLLRILHGRRVAGTLDDPALQLNTKAFSKQHQRLALDYLRKHVPVDEIVNAGLRAEDELAAMERGDAAEEPTSRDAGHPPRSKLYKGTTETKAGAEDGKSVYGPSALDAIRAQYKAKWEAKVKQQEEEKKKREEEERHGKTGPLQVAGKQQTRELSPKMQEYMARAQSDLKEPPKMKKWQRLLPSAAFALSVVGLCVVYAQTYRPPARADRLFPDIPPAAATVGLLILANLAGYVLWKIPPLWGLLNRHFMVVAATPRAPTMLTAIFSHQVLAHLVPNMIFLWMFGVRLHDEIGRGTFLATYFTSGTLAALGTLSLFVLRNRLEMATLGASGALYGVGAAYLWLHRFDHFRIFGLPTPPSEGLQGLTFLALAVGLNIGGFFTAARFTTDITAHLVGAGVGVAAAALLEKRRSARLQPGKREARKGSEGVEAPALPTGR